MKFFIILINGIFWLWLFVIPIGALTFLAFWQYLKSSDNLIYSIIIAIAGIIAGILFAKFIRERYGLDNFFGRTNATPDIDCGTILEKKEKESAV